MNLTPEFLKRLQGMEGSRKGSDGRHLLYKCPAGFWTCGYGHNAEAKGFSEKVATMMLVEDAQDAISDAIKHIPVFCELDTVRQEVLVDLVFNLGVGGVKKFKKMLEALERKDWAEASRQLMDSKYADDVGDGPGGIWDRAERNAKQLLTGERQ